MHDLRQRIMIFKELKDKDLAASVHIIEEANN